MAIRRSNTGRAKLAGRKNPHVVWTNASSQIISNVPTLKKPRSFHGTGTLDAMAKEIEERGLLRIGALFFLRHPIIDIKPYPGEEPPPFPYTRRSATGEMPSVVSGAAAIYAGTIRLEEELGSKKMRVLRHTFIVGSGRRIVSLNNVAPDSYFPASE